MSIPSKIMIRNFIKEYPNKVITVKHLVLTNKVTLFVGENGCGKSTLLKAMMRLIRFKGEIETEHSFSFMPEKPMFPLDLTVDEFLYKLSHMETNDIDYKQLLIRYGLYSKRDELISSLSKGMKAKLNLIQCLLLDRDFYLLDEPFSGLDESSVKILVGEIKNSQKSFIISSHLDDYLYSIDKEVIPFDTIV